MFFNNMHPMLFFMYTIFIAFYRHFQEKLHSMLFSLKAEWNNEFLYFMAMDYLIHSATVVLW